jgi:glycosyltransferase involved in cell wall biosynthesis
MLLHGYFPDDPRVSSEARAAATAGFEIDVVALRRRQDPPTALANGVRCFRLPVEHRRGRGLVAMASEYASFAARAAIIAARLARRRRYDVVQVHSPPDFLVLAALAPRLLGARIVLDVHDLSSDMFMMRFERRPGARLAGRLLRLQERWAARLSTRVITVHEPYRRELVARGVRRDKVSVVMNTLDERLLPPPLDTTGGREFRIVYHGTITPHYGVGLIVEAAAALRESVPRLTVEIYGEGDGVADLRARTRQLGLDDRIRVNEGHRPRVDVLKAVQGASVGIVPNLPTRLNRFALSTKLFEYVALGIPVVSADLPTIREHFSEEEVLFFRAGDAIALAEALEQVACDPGAATRRAKAARRRYEDYRWERSAQTYVQALRAAARRH